jgi:hypothetical protein
MFMVGERGRELVQLDKKGNARIFNNPDTEQLVRSGVVVPGFAAGGTFDQANVNELLKILSFEVDLSNLDNSIEGYNGYEQASQALLAQGISSLTIDNVVNSVDDPNAPFGFKDQQKNQKFRSEDQQLQNGLNQKNLSKEDQQNAQAAQQKLKDAQALIEYFTSLSGIDKQLRAQGVNPIGFINQETDRLRKSGILAKVDGLIAKSDFTNARSVAQTQSNLATSSFSKPLEEYLTKIIDLAENSQKMKLESLKGFAQGSFTDANAFIAGERGPELITLDQKGGAFIYNNAQTKQMLGDYKPKIPGFANGGGFNYSPPAFRGESEIVKELREIRQKINLERPNVTVTSMDDAKIANDIFAASLKRELALGRG